MLGLPMIRHKSWESKDERVSVSKEMPLSGDNLLRSNDLRCRGQSGGKVAPLAMKPQAWIAAKGQAKAK